MVMKNTCIIMPFMNTWVKCTSAITFVLADRSFWILNKYHCHWHNIIKKRGGGSSMAPLVRQSYILTVCWSDLL
jgi:hypothetical protein